MSSRISYDFIIAGMGCAGLSLAMHLINSKVKFEKILILDKELKNINDRTWCFWTKEKNNWYTPIIFNKWDSFIFKSNDFEKKIKLSPYFYCMIKGIDFYSYCIDAIKKDKRFEIVTDSILNIKSENDLGILTCSNQTYQSKFIFNSALRTQQIKSNHVNYLQHFKGWLIEAPDYVFDLNNPVFMDFSVEQKDDCRFIYLIPQSKHTALIEYTGFSPNIIDDDEYNHELNNYIKNNLSIKDYRIIETEKGSIPMAESKFTNIFGKNVINIGTAGGSSKPSTGFTFYFIQKNCQDIIYQLEKNANKIIAPSRSKKYLFYDSVLLNVINNKKTSPKKIFVDLFKKNLPINLLAFLNEETTFIKDLKIMNSVEKSVFIKSAFKVFFKH